MNNTGTLVYSPIRPASTEDKFPTALASEIKGGYKSVLTLAERDAIPTERRDEGMLVHVKETKIVYVLENNTWVFYSNSDNTFKQVQTDNGYVDVTVGGFRKVIMTSDVQFRRGDLPAGSSGTFILQQDSLGSRNAYIPVGDLGTITINPIPGGSTRVDWVSDGENVFWTSTMLDVTEEIQNPQRITNLSITVIDTESVKLSWTSGSGNGTKTNVPATRYAIYYSQSPLTQENFTKATKVIAKITPKLPGNNESYTLNNLRSDNVYYVAVVPETTFFLLRQAPLSNVLQFRTKTSILPEGTSGFIKVRPEQAYMFMHPYKLDSDNEALTEAYLYDANDEIIIENGLPSESSPRGKSMSIQYYITMDWEQYDPVQVVTDLERVVRVDFITCDRDLTPVTNIYTSLTGDDWVYANIMRDDFPVSSKKFYKYDFPDEAKFCRYIKFETVPKGSSYDIREVTVHGSEITLPAIPNGKRLKLQVPRKRFELATGTNSFLNEQAEDYGQFGKVIRFYNNWDWMVSLADQAVGSTYTLGTTKPVPYEFSTSRLWNFDEKLQHVKDLGLIALWSHQKIPEFLVMPEYRSKPARHDYRALDTAQIPTATDKEDPMSWRFVAQYFYQIAARYGSNTNIPDANLRLASDEPIRKGLGLIKYLEYYNEPDATWYDQPGFHSPYQMAAFMSAAYDGHKGALGEGFGAKNADPNMIMVFPGLADNNTGYLKFMLNWWDTHRGIGDYPFDCYNWHFYSNLRRGQTTKNELPEIGLPPEIGQMEEICNEVSSLRNERFPLKEIWLTEFGYDQHPASPQGARSIGSRSIGLVKSDWLMRTFIIGLMTNVDVMVQFMYRAAGSYLAEVIASGYPSKFASCGYVDLLGVPEDRYHDKDGNPIDPRLDAYFYIGGLIKEMEGMKFSHIIKDKFGTHVDDILVNPDPDIYAVVFVPDQGVAKSPCIVMWLSSMTERSTNVTLKTDGVTSLTMSVYRDIEVDKTLISKKVQVGTGIVDGGYRAASIPLSETPVIVWSTKIGVPAIKVPYNVEVTSLSNDTLRVTWWDNNDKDYKAQIYMATDANGEFVKIAEDFYADCGYTVIGLPSGTPRWFLVRFVSIDGTRTSDYSTMVSGTTNQSVIGPTNFRKVSANVNRLTLGWEFNEQDESKITGFEIFKSLTPTGSYNLLATLSKTQRTFSDVGLKEDTTYFYKLRAIAPLGNSDLSGVLAATTTQAQVLPPEILYKNTTYFGDKVFVWFNIPVKNASGSESKFTVYEEGATNPIKTITAFEIDQSSQRLAIILSKDTPIEDKMNVVTVGYDGTGNLSSIYDIKVAAFTDELVENLKGDQSLVINKISLSFNGWNGDDYGVEFSPAAGEYFNEIPTSTEKYDLGTNYVLPKLINMSGADTTMELIMPMVQGTGITYKTDAQLQPSYTPMLPLTEFPSKVAAKGLNNGYTFNVQRTAFLNLNPANRYNVKALISVGSYQTNPIYGKGYINDDQTTAQTVLATGNDGTRLMHWENLKPITGLIPVGATNVPLSLNRAKIIVDITAVENGKTFVACGLYLEEVVEHIPLL